MFLSLLWKECKMWTKSIIFYGYVILMFLFYITQMGDGEVIEKPEPGMDNYGTVYSEDERVIMNGTLNHLIQDYHQGQFATYPIGFYKQVKMSEEDSKVIAECISELTGMEGEVTEEMQVKESLTYQEFEAVMEKVTKIAGPGSDYSKKALKKNGIAPKTYEQAVQEYEDVLQKDKLTGAYARLFSDYMGIMLGILPAFFAVSRALKDKKNQSEEVIYAKKIHSATLVISRYASMVIMIFLPLLLLSILSLMQSVYIAKAISVSPDYFAYIKYAFGWLLPTVLFVAALSYMVTMLTEKMLGILLSVVCWLTAMFSADSLKYFGWNLIPRFNSLGEHQMFEDMFGQLVYNRCMYVALSVLILLVMVWIYDKKRKGELGRNGTLLQNRSRKCKV